MMTKNYDESVKINQNRNWPYIPNHPYWILIIGGSGSGTTNVLLNLMNDQMLYQMLYQRPDVNRIYLYVKDPFKSKYQLLLNRKEKV